VNRQEIGERDEIEHNIYNINKQTNIILYYVTEIVQIKGFALFCNWYDITTGNIIHLVGDTLNVNQFIWVGRGLMNVFVYCYKSIWLTNKII